MAPSGGQEGAGRSLMVLEEQVDADHEPNEHEVLEYAEWLGIDMDKDSDLLWIAREGLKAPLPAPWRPCQTNEGGEGELFYFNFETGESVWDHPCDEYHRALYQKERAAKYGLPYDAPDVKNPNAPHETQKTARAPTSGGGKTVGLAPASSMSSADDPSDASGTLGDSGSASGDGEKKKGKKDKKEKKEKKDKKDKGGKQQQDLGSPSGGKQLAPLKGRVGAPTTGLSGMDADVATSRDDSDEDSEDDDSPKKKLGPSPDVGRGGLGGGAAGLPAAAADLAPIKEEPTQEDLRALSQDSLHMSVGARRTTPMPKETDLDTEVQSVMAEYRKDRESTVRQTLDKEVEDWAASERVRRKEAMEVELAAWLAGERKTQREALDRQLADWISEEKKKSQDEFDKKVQELEAEMKAKAAKHRKDIQEQFDVEKDSIYQELQDKHDKQIRDEKQRLQQELRAKKGLMEQEAESSASLEASLRSQLDEAEAAAKQLRTKVGELEKQLEETRNDTSRRIQELEGEKEEAQKKAADAAGAQGDASSKDLEDARAQVREKTKELEDAKALAERTSKELEEAKAQGDRTSKELEEAKAQGDRMSKELEEAKAQGDRASKELKEAKAQGDRTSKELEDAKAQASRVSKDLEEAKAQTERQARELDDTKAEASRKSQELEQQLAAARTGSSAEAQQLQAQLKDKEADLTRVKAEKNEEIEQVLAEKAAEIRRLRDEMASDMERAKKEAAEETARLRQQLSVGDASSSAAMESVRAQLRERDDTLASLRTEVARLKAELDDERTRGVRAASDAKARESMESHEKMRVTSLQSQLDERAKELESLRDSRLELERKVATLTDELQYAKSDKMDVERRTTMVSEDAQRAKSERMDLERRVSALTEDLQRAKADASAKAIVAERELAAKAKDLEYANGMVSQKAEEISRLSQQLTMGDASTSAAMQGLREQLRERDDSIMASTAETRRLKLLLEDEKAAASRAQSDAAGAAKKAAAELALLSAELDARSTECGRLRAELDARRMQESAAGPKDADVREVINLRAQVQEQRAEIELLRERASKPVGTLTPAEEQKLRDALRDRDDALQTLKAESRRSNAALQGDIEALQVQLADATAGIEDARQRAEGSAGEVIELQAKLRTRAAEVDRLHSDLRSAGTEAERLRGEAKRAAEAASVAEADKVSANEQWRHEVDRLEALLRERASDLTVAREQADKAAREARRFEMEEHRNSSRFAQLQTEAERLRAQLQELRDQRSEAERRLEGQLEEERAASARALAEGRAAVARAQTEQAAVVAELEVRAAECGRLRTEVATRAAEATGAKDAELRELVSLRAQVIEQRAEIERLRAPSGHSVETDRSLRRLQESDATVLALKAEIAQACSSHTMTLETLHGELASSKAASEASRRKAEGDAEALAEAQATLRSRASEVEKLHSEVRSQAGDLEQLRCEARSTESRLTSKAAATVEAAKAAAAEQWRRELQRLEDALEERTSAADIARELADRSSRDLRRVELDERRVAKRAEALHIEMEAARLQLQHVREEATDAERHIEDARMAARKEHAARMHVEGQMRELQREVRGMRDHLQQRASEMDISEGEVRKCRNELVEREREVMTLLEQIRAAESELRRCRCAQDAQSHEADLLKRRLAKLSDRERLIIERDVGEEREPMVRDSGLDLAGYRTAAELLKLQQDEAELTLRHPTVGDAAMPALGKLAGDGEAQAPEHAGMPGDGRARLSREHSGVLNSDDGGDIEATEQDRADAELQGACGSGTETLGAGLDAPGALEGRRRELRRERAALEELRRQWKVDAQRARSLGGGQSQAILHSVRSALDERASALNRSIDELRSLERSLPAHRRGGGKPSHSPGIGDKHDHGGSDIVPVGGGGDVLPAGEAELLRRWRHMLSPSRSPYSLPFGGYYDRPLSAGAGSRRHLRSGGRTAREQSRDAIDHHLQHLRSFARDVGHHGRAWTARGGYDRGFV